MADSDSKLAEEFGAFGGRCGRLGGRKQESKACGWVYQTEVAKTPQLWMDMRGIGRIRRLTRLRAAAGILKKRGARLHKRRTPTRPLFRPSMQNMNIYTEPLSSESESDVESQYRGRDHADKRLTCRVR